MNAPNAPRLKVEANVDIGLASFDGALAPFSNPN
jgi:hypothetical protein